MTESKVGSILLLIAGILTLVGAVIVLIIGLVLGSFGEDAAVALIIFVVLFFVLLITGVLKIYAAQMMKDPKRTSSGGILGLVVGIISGFDVLAIVGGILGIVDGGKR